MFLRTKEVKNNKYCYLVENKWKKNKGSRQETKEYLGPVEELETKNDKSFYEFYSIENLNNFLENKSKEELLKKLVFWELNKAGFEEKTDYFINENNIRVDKDSLGPVKNGKDYVLSINEGYLCGFTIERIKDFEATGDIEKDSQKLARFFVDAGIEVPEKVLIGFYEKV